MNTPNSELFAKFYDGFTHFVSLSILPNSVEFKTASQPHNACDCARRRINELSLPLHAIVTGHNSFKIQPIN